MKLQKGVRRMNHSFIRQSGTKAELFIYGDIVDDAYLESDITQYKIAQQLSQTNAEEIDVYISSYGGSVNAGLAIYNELRRHKAKIKTVCDSFACSIASVIFMAGDERVMNETSLLMIHNAWTYAMGNSEQLRKQAEDLEKITQASVEAYKAHSSLSEKEIKALMDAETWILPEEALEYGFATSINKTEKTAASQNSFRKLFELIKANQKAKAEEPEDESPEEEPEKTGEDEPTDEPENEPDEPDKDDEKENEEKAEETTQLWSGFFNAILKNQK